ncbi:MAG: Na/Pi cotransporter family protein [Peptoniphilus sp.]|nr:Na/Pi cotransporter family protein [Peptoniphilus sp.]MDY6044868.1 Na/Pi cotransporter family protein [Peptoniphilus sp.]
MGDVSSWSQIDWHYIAGGLGLFLFGVKIMGDNLTKFAGTKIRDYIEKYTSNPIMAVIVGIAMTGIIQSSSAATVIAISLVRSGLMGLSQAIAIILGANIGTTVTSILIGFQLDYLAYFILMVGVFLVLMASKKKTTYLGEIIIGFGLLFIGLNMMGGALKELQNIPGFKDLVVKMSSQPFLAAFAGAILTAIIQSSSAIVGIVQSLYSTDSITLMAALGLVFGANIGTTVTAALAAVGGSLAARRTSLFHFLFNVTVSVFFLIIIGPYSRVIHYVTTTFHLNSMMTIAFAHFTFNFVGMLIFLPLIPKCVVALQKIMPGKDELSVEIGKIQLDEAMVSAFPAGALAQAKSAMLKVADIVLEGMECSKHYLTTKDKKYFHEVNQLEDMINTLDTKIEGYLLKISKQSLTEELADEYSSNLQVQKNFERIGDLVQNLVEYYEMIYDSGEEFSEEAMTELLAVYELLLHMFSNGVDVFNGGSHHLYEMMKEDENNLNYMEYQLRASHFRRMTSQHEEATVVTSLYVDILGTLERIGDHAFNIARLTFDPIKSHGEKSLIAEELQSKAGA